MKKSIVLKLVAGLLSAGITVAGVANYAENMNVNSNQNVEEVSACAETEEVQAANKAVDAKVISNDVVEELEVAEEEPAVVAEVQTAEQTVIAESKETEVAKVAESKEVAPVAKSKETEAAQIIVESKKSEAEAVIIENKESASTPAATAEPASTPAATAKPAAVVESNPVVVKTEEVAAVEDEDEDDAPMVVESNTCTVVVNIVKEPEAPAEVADCVIGHRYCVCGASFDIWKIAGLDNEAWTAHAREHASKGELVRWTDK